MRNLTIPKLLLIFAVIISFSSCKKEDMPEKKKSVHLVQYIFSSSSDAVDFTLIYTDYQGNTQTDHNMPNSFTYAFNAPPGYLGFSVMGGPSSADADISIYIDHNLWQHQHVNATTYVYATVSGTLQ